MPTADEMAEAIQTIDGLQASSEYVEHRNRVVEALNIAFELQAPADGSDPPPWTEELYRSLYKSHNDVVNGIDAMRDAVAAVKAEMANEEATLESIQTAYERIPQWTKHVSDLISTTEGLIEELRTKILALRKEQSVENLKRHFPNLHPDANQRLETAAAAVKATGYVLLGITLVFPKAAPVTALIGGLSKLGLFVADKVTHYVLTGQDQADEQLMSEAEPLLQAGYERTDYSEVAEYAGQFVELTTTVLGAVVSFGPLADAAKEVVEQVKKGFETAGEGIEDLNKILKAFYDEQIKADLQRQKYSPTEVLQRLDDLLGGGDLPMAARPGEAEEQAAWNQLADGIGEALNIPAEEEWGAFQAAVNWAETVADASGYMLGSQRVNGRWTPELFITDEAVEIAIAWGAVDQTGLNLNYMPDAYAERASGSQTPSASIDQD